LLETPYFLGSQRQLQSFHKCENRLVSTAALLARSPLVSGILLVAFFHSAPRWLPSKREHLHFATYSLLVHGVGFIVILRCHSVP
jgi:hypothetical protein